MPGEPRADVELTVPADGIYAAVVRTAAAALAARMEFTIDEIEDLRIAIGEAIALSIDAAEADAQLTCLFFLTSPTIRVSLCVPSPTGDAQQLDTGSFAWQVLDTMAEDARTHVDGDVFTISFALTSQVAPPSNSAPATGPLGVDR